MFHFTCDEEIERIGRGLRDRTLPKAEWTHAAHFAAAFWLLRDRDAAALCEMPALIRAYNEATGVANTDASGYHETITAASLRAARAWLASRPDMKTYSALNELLASQFGRSDWPLVYWCAELLFSVRARKTWVEPDRKPLPF
jgi:hypothetical protein